MQLQDLQSLYLRFLLNDVKKAPAKKGKKIYWMHTIPFWSDAVKNELCFQEKAQIVGCELSRVCEPDFDPEKLGIPEGASHGLAYIHLKNLPAGTYFIITAGYKYMNGSVPNGELGITIIADLSPGIPDEPEILPEEPDNSPVWYQYDQSGNRIKTNKK